MVHLASVEMKESIENLLVPCEPKIRIEISWEIIFISIPMCEQLTFHFCLSLFHGVRVGEDVKACVFIRQLFALWAMNYFLLQNMKLEWSKDGQTTLLVVWAMDLYWFSRTFFNWIVIKMSNKALWTILRSALCLLCWWKHSASLRSQSTLESCSMNWNPSLGSRAKRVQDDALSSLLFPLFLSDRRTEQLFVSASSEYVLARKWAQTTRYWMYLYLHLWRRRRVPVTQCSDTDLKSRDQRSQLDSVEPRCTTAENYDQLDRCPPPHTFFFTGVECLQSSVHSCEDHVFCTVSRLFWSEQCFRSNLIKSASIRHKLSG